MTKDTGAVRTEGRTLSVGRRVATAGELPATLPIGSWSQAPDGNVSRWHRLEMGWVRRSEPTNSRVACL
jgi:hypothetical protein